MKKIVLLFTFISLLQLSLFANGAVVFMYHRFGETTYPSTNITLEQFQFQLDYLEKNNYDVWHLSKIINHLKNNKELPPKTVALTIDDAYISVYSRAYPMLKKKNFPFTVMVSTNPVDNKSPYYMSWDMMREMKNHGAQYVNHSASHEYLLERKNETTYEWEKRFTKEVNKAQKRLHEELGDDTNQNPKMFSYPFGEYDAKTKRVLRRLGYFGITQTSGPIDSNSDFLQLPRFPMAEPFATPNGFKTKLNTVTLPIKNLSNDDTIITYNNPPQLNLELEKPLNIKCYLSSGKVIPTHMISKTHVQIKSDTKLSPPREKYTCTAPAKDGKWHWYSHLWIIK